MLRALPLTEELVQVAGDGGVPVGGGALVAQRNVGCGVAEAVQWLCAAQEGALATRLSTARKAKALVRGTTWAVERATRIELALSAWEADVLPLNYARRTLGV